jgi:hypothetical protein
MIPPSTKSASGTSARTSRDRAGEIALAST